MRSPGSDSCPHGQAFRFGGVLRTASGNDHNRQRKAYRGAREAPHIGWPAVLTASALVACAGV